MLKKLELGNFKAFGDIQTIDLKPLTLLFGANSAGKSTILQSLIYLSEAFKQKNWDIYSTRQGGEFIDFGGLQNIVHQKSFNNIIHFGLTVSGFIIVTPSDIFGDDAEDLIDTIESLLVKIRRNKQIEKSELEDNQIPYYVCTFTVRFGIHPGANKIEYFSITEEHADFITYSDDEAEVVNVEPEGEVLSIHRIADGVQYDVKTIKPFSRFFLKHYLFDQRRIDEIQNLNKAVVDKAAFENMLIKEIMHAGIDYDDEQFIAFWINDDDEYGIKLTPIHKLIEDELNNLNSFFGFDDNVDDILYPIENPVTINKFISKITHLGYFRPVPDRFIYKKSERQPVENDSIAIWSFLLDNVSLRNQVNKYLSASDKMDVGYQLEVQTWKNQLESSQYNRQFDLLEIRDLHSNTIVNLRELGQGVVQIIPILAAVLSDESNLISIEQPELHLHPGLQSRLGKILAEATREKSYKSILEIFSDPPKKQLLVETHSEHIIKAIQLEVAKRDELRSDKVSILYIQKDTEKPQSLVRKLTLDDSGSFTEPWPDDFFESSSDLTYERLMLTNKN